MGTLMKVLAESFPMNTNMIGFSWLSKIFVLWTKVASALEGLMLTVAKSRLTILMKFYVLRHSWENV